MLYLAYKYADDLKAGLFSNANLGGDNVHRGTVLGAILGLANNSIPNELYDALRGKDLINEEITALLN